MTDVFSALIQLKLVRQGAYISAIGALVGGLGSAAYTYRYSHSIGGGLSLPSPCPCHRPTPPLLLEEQITVIL